MNSFFSKYLLIPPLISVAFIIILSIENIQSHLSLNFYTIFLIYFVLLDAPHGILSAYRVVSNKSQYSLHGLWLKKSFLIQLLVPLCMIPIFIPELNFFVTPDFRGNRNGVLGVILIIWLSFLFHHNIKQNFGILSLLSSRQSKNQNFKIQKYSKQLCFFACGLYFFNGGYQSDFIPYKLILSPSINSVFLGLFIILIAFHSVLFFGELLKKRSDFNIIDFYCLSIVCFYFLVVNSPFLALWGLILINVPHTIQYIFLIGSYRKVDSDNFPDQQTKIGRFFTRYPFFGYLTLVASGFILFSGILVSFFEVIFRFVSLQNAEYLPGDMAMACLISLSLQHFFLDSKIWRLSKDPNTSDNLKQLVYYEENRA